jgi:hypothetical protein
MHSNALVPIRISLTPRSLQNFGTVRFRALSTNVAAERSEYPVLAGPTHVSGMILKRFPSGLKRPRPSQQAALRSGIWRARTATQSRKGRTVPSGVSLRGGSLSLFTARHAIVGDKASGRAAIMLRTGLGCRNGARSGSKHDAHTFARTLLPLQTIWSPKLISRPA